MSRYLTQPIHLGTQLKTTTGTNREPYLWCQFVKLKVLRHKMDTKEQQLEGYHIYNEVGIHQPRLPSTG